MADTPRSALSPDDRSQDPGRDPDDPEVRRRHDESGRARRTPYVPSTRGPSDEPVPAVPHEGFLGRLAVSLLAGEVVVLAVLAVWGFIGSAGGTAARVLGLSLNVPHATLLIVTAALGALACTRTRWLRRYGVTQAVVYFIVFAFGSAMSVNTPDSSGLALNGPDHLLHAVLAVLGVVIAMISGARVLEPPPGPVPYPNGRTDAPEIEAEHEAHQRRDRGERARH